MSRVRIVGIAAAIIVVIILGWAAVDKLQTWRKGNGAAEAALITESYDRADQIEALKLKMANAPIKTVIKYVPRSVPGKTGVADVPAICKECFEGLILPVPLAVSA